MDFQFDSTVDGKAIKIASMVDEHTRESLLNLVERSITAERLVAELERVFAAAGGPPMVLRMDNGPELVSQALQQFCDGKVGLSYIPPGTWNNGYIESFNNRPPTDAMPQRPPPRPQPSPRRPRRLPRPRRWRTHLLALPKLRRAGVRATVEYGVERGKPLLGCLDVLPCSHGHPLCRLLSRQVFRQSELSFPV